MSNSQPMNPPSIEELNATLHAYNFLSLLQATDFCCHYKALRRDDQMPILIHLALRGHYGDRLIDQAKRGYKLRHPNLLSIYDCGKTTKYCYAISRFVEGEMLEDIIQQSPSSLRQSASYITEIASVLNLCQKRCIIPEHIHPDNIIVDSTNHALISLLRMPFHPDYIYTMAPELRDAQCCANEKTNIFSLGSILNTLITGKIQLNEDGSSKLPTPIIKVSPELNQLILSMTAFEANDRPDSLVDCIQKLESLELDGTIYKPNPSAGAKTIPVIGLPSAPNHSILPSQESVAPSATPPTPPQIQQKRPITQQPTSRRAPSPPMQKKHTNFFFYTIPLLLVCISFFYTYYLYKQDFATARNKAIAEKKVEKTPEEPKAPDLSDEDLNNPEGKGLTTIAGDMPEEAPEEAIGASLADDEDDEESEEAFRADPLDINPDGPNNWCRIGIPIIKQSLNFRGAKTYTAYRATDGKLDDNGKVAAAVAEGNKNAWWRIDFGADNLRKISQIKILGPGEISLPGKENKSFTITIASAEGKIIAQHSCPKTPAIWTLPEPIEARGVRIDAISPMDILIFREIEIIGPAE